MAVNKEELFQNVGRGERPQHMCLDPGAKNHATRGPSTSHGALCGELVSARAAQRVLCRPPAPPRPRESCRPSQPVFGICIREIPTASASWTAAGGRQIFFGWSPKWVSHRTATIIRSAGRSSCFFAKLSGAPGLALQPGRLPQTVPVGQHRGPLSGRHRGGP